MDFTPLLPDGGAALLTPSHVRTLLFGGGGAEFALPPTEAEEQRAQRLTPRTDSIVLEMTEEEPEGASLLVATLRARPIRESDLLHARVTRNSVFLREDEAER